MLKKITAFALAICMLFAAACSDDNSTDTSKAETTTSASEATEDSSSEAEASVSESSESDDSSVGESVTTTEAATVSETTTTTEATTTADDSSAADKTTTTTKATAGGESSSTTTKSTSTTSKYIPPKTTTTTTKKVTTTTTTKKVTSPSVSVQPGDHSDPSSYIKPTGLSKLEDAVWETSFQSNYTNSKYNNIIRNELIKYGQAYCKKVGVPKYYVCAEMYPYYDKNKKPLYVPSDMKGNTIAVGSCVEFPYDEQWTLYGYFKSAQERLNEVKAFINRMYLLIERVICNSMRHGIENIPWNITYGLEGGGMTWTVMSGFPDDSGKGWEIFYN